MHLHRLSLPLACALACASASRWHETRELHRDDQVLVQVEAKESVSYAHPFAVDEVRLAEQLCELRFEDRADVTHKDQSRVPWSCPDAQKVAAGIARGLALAGPTERVRFWVHWQQDDPAAPWYLPDERHTRGVAYRNAAGQLEMDFDLVARVQAQGGRAARAPDEGKHRRARFVPPEGVELAISDGKRQPMRLIWPIAGASGRDTVKPDVDPERDARLDLLEQMHRAGDIDDATYERKKAELGQTQ